MTTDIPCQMRRKKRREREPEADEEHRDEHAEPHDHVEPAVGQGKDVRSQEQAPGDPEGDPGQEGEADVADVVAETVVAKRRLERGSRNRSRSRSRRSRHPDGSPPGVDVSIGPICLLGPPPEMMGAGAPACQPVSPRPPSHQPRGPSDRPLLMWSDSPPSYWPPSAWAHPKPIAGTDGRDFRHVGGPVTSGGP